MALITVAARSELIALYVAMFKAAPGANNLTDMVAAYEAGGTTSTIAKTLAAKADFATVYPGFTTAQEFAASLVTTLLGSDVTAAITTWSTDYVVGLLNAGKTRADAIVTAVVALRATANTEFTVAKAALTNKVDVASYYSMTQGQSSTSLSVLQGVIAGVTSVAGTVATSKTAVDTSSVSASSQNFRLTTDIDTFNGSVGADKFSATPFEGLDTFTALDALDGGAGNDMLTIASGAVGGLTIPAGATVINIETATLASNVSVTADVSTWTGLTNLTASSGGATTITAAATTNVTESGSVGASTITGGKDVTVVHSTAGAVVVDAAAGAVKVTNNLIAGATTLGLTNGTVANTVKGAVTVAAKGNVSIGGGTTHDITFTESSAYAARVANASSVISTTAADSSTTGAASLAVTAATVKNAGLLVLTTALGIATTVAENNAATTAALNGGFITRTEKVAIDAAFVTSFNVDAVVATAVAAALAVETPLVTAAANAALAATATKTTVTTTKDAAIALNNVDLTGGLGQPNRTLTDTSVNNTALISAKVTGGYGTGTANITGTALTTVTLDNAAPSTLTSNVLTNVSVSNVVGATGNVTITNATVGHTQNLTLSNVGTAATSTVAAARFTVADTAAATVNLVSNGTANNVILTAGTATALNLTGAGAFDGVVARVAAKAQVFTNDVNVAAGTVSARVAAVEANTGLTLAAAAVITATGSTGANTVLIGAGQSYLGGSGVDTVWTSAAVQTVAVDGGAGTADKLVVSNLTNIGVNVDGTGSAKFTGFEVLETKVTGTIDLSTTLLGNTLTSVIIAPVVAADGANGHASATINGLNATQANAVTISTAPNSTGYVLGVTGATSVGQLDSVTVNAGAALGLLSIAGVETLNITPSAGTNFVYGNAGALGTVNVTGGSSAVYISGAAVALNPNTVIDASKGTGKAMLNIVNATANGAKLVGSATANNVLTSNGLSSVLVGGAGNDILRGGAGDDSISAGNGNNTVVTGNGINTVTLGNGMNLVTGGTAVDTITVGTGTNWINTGGALDVITLGAHALGNVHTIDLADAGRTVANVVTINGFNSGVDKINLSTIAGASLDTLDLTTTSTQAAMLAPVTDVTSVATLANVITALTTATGLGGGGAVAGHEFAASSAAAGGLVARTVVYTTGAAAGTYLVINDDTAGFNDADDIVIKLTGKTTVAAGDIVAAGTAYSVTPTQAFTASVGRDSFVGGDLNDTFSVGFSGSTGAVNVLNTLNVAALDALVGGGNGPLAPVISGVTGQVAGDLLTIGSVGDTTTGTSANLTLVATDFANISGIENLVISSTGTGAQNLTLGTAYSSAGTPGFKFLNTNSTTGAIVIDANAVTGAGNAFKATTTQTGGNITITGSSAGTNTITALVGSGSTAGTTAVTSTITIVGGAGVDTISATSGVITTGVPGTGAISITGAGGNDAITLGLGAHGVATIVWATGGGIDTVTNFTQGTDIISAGVSTGGAAATVVSSIDATTALTMGATDEVLVLRTADGTFTDLAAVAVRLALNTESFVDTDTFYVVWTATTGGLTHVSRLTTDATANTTFDGADTLVDMVILVGTTNSTAMTAASFAVIA
jgi:RTX calcium-binding nonapeptide repeat (4 copies)